MLSERLSQLPYLLHTNRELGLMLRGVKPLAYFMEVVGREPDCLVRYWRMFDRQVALHRFIKREFVEPAPEHPPLQSHSIFYSLPDEEWRIDALRTLLAQPGAWSCDRERRFGELLGYEDWQNNYWLCHLNS
jgi:hypothetical protein